MEIQWWLAELDMHGNPTLCDGSHSERAGAEKALYLYSRLGLGRNKRYAIARVELTTPEGGRHDVNEEALGMLNEAGLRP